MRTTPIHGHVTHRLRATARATCLALSLGLGLLAATPAHAYDFDRGNAPIDVIIPTVIPVIFASVAPGDATLVLRSTTLITNAMFDAIAPYHATAVGVYSRLPRRPASEGLTDRQRNIAVFYACQEVLDSLYPAEKARWDDMLRSVGLDPNLQSTGFAHRRRLGPCGRQGRGGRPRKRRHEPAGQRQWSAFSPHALCRHHRLCAGEHGV